MKLLIASLLIHRDVDTFIFNWFCSRIHLKDGFSLPHLILNDGSLTDDDFRKLERLTNIIIEKDPVEIYKDVPRDKYLAKVKLFEIGFVKYNAERVLIMDPDIFFLRSWDSDLVKILMSDFICQLNFGSGIGPEPDKYKQLFMISENAQNLACNSGMVSTTKKDYHRILLSLVTHLNDPFLIMEDQGVLFAAGYGIMSYIDGIKVAVNGAGEYKETWDWLMSQNGVHLVTMRQRKKEYEWVVQHALNLLPRTVHLDTFKPVDYHIDGGILSYGTYNFDFPYAMFPSRCKSIFVTDALYLSGGSYIKWIFPPQITKFEASIMPLDNSIQENMKDIEINGNRYMLGTFNIIDLPNHELMIKTLPGEKTYYALTYPKLHYTLDKPSTVFES